MMELAPSSSRLSSSSSSSLHLLVLLASLAGVARLTRVRERERVRDVKQESSQCLCFFFLVSIYAPQSHFFFEKRATA